MSQPLGYKSLLGGIALLLFACFPAEGAIAPSNVLVLYNTASTEGTELANYYAKVHPGVQLLGLTGVTTDEEVTANYYLSTIRPQILPALNSSISTIVTTKGLPLRIRVAEPRPSSYTDPFDVTRSTSSYYWRTYSSLESELTRIDQICMPEQMGDQKYQEAWDLGAPNYPQPARNPYYGVTTSFNYNDYCLPNYGGMRLTSRLDGYTVSDVKAAINKAQKAYVSFYAPSYPYVVMDNDPNASAASQWLMQQLHDNVIDASGQQHVYDPTSAAITSAPGSVIGYVSHGIHGAGVSQDYILNLSFSMANGAVFDTHESYNAYTFNGQPGENPKGQGLVADWLSKGGTVGIGNVQEPYSGMNYEANEDQLFRMLLNGYTWAEAAWSSMRQLSYVNTVVGDPLMTWKPAIPGDANLDGSVNGTDTNTVLSNYNLSGKYWQDGDFNGDGSVNGSDLNIVLAEFNRSSQASSSATVPEPGIMGMLALGGILALMAASQRRRTASNR